MGSLASKLYSHYPPVRPEGEGPITVDGSNPSVPIIGWSGGISDVGGLEWKLTEIDSALILQEGVLTSLENGMIKNTSDQLTNYFISQNIPHFVGYFSGYTNANFVSTPDIIPTLNQSFASGVTSNSSLSRLTVSSAGLYLVIAHTMGIFQTTTSGVLYLQIKNSGSLIQQASGSNPAASYGVLDLMTSTLVSLTANEYVSFNLSGTHGNVNIYTYPHSSVMMVRIK